MMEFINKLRLPYREDKLFGLLLLLIFFVPLAFNPWLLEGYETTRFPLAVILIGAMVLWVAYKKYALSVNFLSLTVLAFVLINVLSVFSSEDKIISLFGLYGRFTGSLVFVLAWALLLILTGNLKNLEKYYFFLKALFFGGLLVSILGILHIYGIGFYAGLDAGARPIVPSFIGNQNFAAMYLVGLLPFALPLYFYYARNLYSKLYYLISSFVYIWAIMLFASRGAILALVVLLGVGLFLLLIKRFNKFIIGTVLVFTIFTGVLGGLFYSTTRVAVPNLGVSAAELTVQARYVVWTKSLDIIKENWLLGLGPGNFFIGFKGFADNILPSNERFDDAHNLYLQLATTIGVFGALLFIISLFLAIYTALKEFWKTNDLLPLGLLLGLIGLAIACAFNPVSLPLWVLFAVLIGIISGLYSRGSELTFSFNTKALRIIAYLLGIFFVVFSIVFYLAWLLSTAAVYNYKAKDFVTSEKYSRLALTVYPFNTTASGYHIASLIRLKDQDFDKIRKEINKFEQSHANSSGTQKNTADLLFMLYELSKDPKDLEQSIYHLKLANDLEPNYSQLLINTGYLLFKAEKYSEAETYLKQAVSLTNQGRFFYAELLLAQIELNKGNYESALRFVTRAQKIESNPLFEQIIQKIKTRSLPNNQLPIFLPPVDI